jgi:hypothetical protein
MESEMLIKQFTEITDPEIWDLSENDDIILTREGCKEQRVLINLKTYQAFKDMLLQFQQQDSGLAAQFDFNPYLQDFIDILNHDKFEDITDDDSYFQNLARNIK